MKRRLRGPAIVAVIAGILAAAGYGWFFGRNEPIPSEPAAISDTRIAARPVATVKVGPIKKGTVAEEITAYGTVVPAAGAVQTLSVPFESRVRRVLVTEAQKVSQGNTLLEIEPSPDTNLQTQQARNDYEAAQKALQYMQQRLDLQLATNDQLLQTQQALEQAKAKLESMRRRGSEGPRTVRADVTGLISKVAVQEGAIVPAGSPMVEMVAENRLEVRLGVEPEDIDRVKLNQEVSLTRVNRPGSDRVIGRIRKISRATDATTRLVQLFTDLPSSSRFLLGEYILGKISVASAQGLMVPRSAVLPQADHYVLFTLKDGRAKEHNVRIGLQNERDIEVIAADLQPGDMVVTLGNYELKDGMSVKVEPSR